MKSVWSLIKRFLRLPKKFLIIGLIILIGLGGFLFQRMKSQTPPQTVTVQKQTLKQLVSASGTLSGSNIANLHFQSGGRLATINVKVGDKVSQGDTIATLDAQALAINLREAQNSLADKKATLEKIYDDIHLFQYGNGGFGNVGTANETEAQKATRTSAEQAANNAQESVNAAYRAFQDSVILSPLDGVVTAQTPVPGQNVTAADTIAQVIDFNKVVFNADVDEADISKISIGQRVEVTLDAYGDRIFKGTVTDILPQTKTASNGGTVVTVKITMDDQSIRQISGLNGSVNILIKQIDNVLSVPQDAVTSDNLVVIKENNSYVAKKVTTGFQSDTDVEITSGLKEGDLVLQNPTDYLKNHPNLKNHVQ